MPSDNPIRDIALSYGERGWRVIPVWPPSASGSGGCQCPKKGQCTSPGKHPMGHRWQERATADALQIERWWNERPDMNIGVKFGEHSGIIDVECDDADAETELLRLLGSDPPICPTFQARRGKHRLFQWQRGLPEQAVIKIRGIEFRLGNGERGAQSVFPPSKHATGAVYQWLEGLTPEDVDPAPLPQALVTALLAADPTRSSTRRRSERQWRALARDGAPDGERNVSAAAFIGKLLTSMADPSNDEALGIYWEMVTSWADRCQPPIDPRELEATWASIVRAERERRLQDVLSQQFTAWQSPVPLPGEVPPGKAVAAVRNGSGHADPTGKNGASKNGTPKNGDAKATPEDGEVLPGWRLIIVKSDPRTFLLKAPFWQHRAPRGGYLELTADQMQSWSKICLAAMNVDSLPPRDIGKFWHDKGENKGILSQLHAAAIYKEAPADVIWQLNVAEFILDLIDRAPVLEEAEEGGYKESDVNYRVYRLPTGGGALRVTDLLQEAKKAGERWDRKQVVAVLERFKTREQQPKIGGRQRRLWIVTPEIQAAMYKAVKVRPEKNPATAAPPPDAAPAERSPAEPASQPPPQQPPAETQPDGPDPAA